MKIKTAIVGTGRIGFLLEKDSLRYHPCTHAGSIKYINEFTDASDESKFEIIGICDLNHTRMMEFEKWWGKEIQYKTESYRKLIDQSEFDFIVISSDFQSHFEICMYAIENGIKYIMLEKPACESSEEIEILINTAKKHKTQIWVNFERRYHPGYLQIKKIIEETPPEKLRSIRGRVLTGALRSKNEGSPFLVDGIHWLDLLIWYFGKPDDYSHRIVKSKYGPADTVFFDFNYGNVFGRLEAGGRRKFFEFELEIDFEDMRISGGNSGFKLWVNKDSDKYENFMELKEQELLFEKKNPWCEMYSEVKNVIQYGGYGTVNSPVTDSHMSLKLIEPFH